MNAVPVYRAGTGIREVAVPDLVGVFRQLDAFELLLSIRVEQTQLDLGSIGGEEREVHAQAVPVGAQRERLSFAQPAFRHLAC
jgi:hypothetical protein